MYYKTSEEFKEVAGYDLERGWYPRVTKILEIKAKPALYKFYGELGSFDEGEQIKEKSASEGTLVHEACQAILLGQSPDFDPVIKPAVDAFRAFIDKTPIHTSAEFIERRIVNHTERYTGTIDALALIDGQYGVLDIKTSQSIYRDYNLQTAAYMGALEKQYPKLQTRWILRIDQAKECMTCGASLRQKGGRDKIRAGFGKGNPKCEHTWSDMRGVVELKEFPYWQNDYKAFLAAKKLWEWENDYWLRQVGYL